MLAACRSFPTRCVTVCFLGPFFSHFGNALLVSGLPDVMGDLELHNLNFRKSKEVNEGEAEAGGWESLHISKERHLVMNWRKPSVPHNLRFIRQTALHAVRCEEAVLLLSKIHHLMISFGVFKQSCHF